VGNEVSSGGEEIETRSVIAKEPMRVFDRLLVFEFCVVIVEDVDIRREVVIGTITTGNGAYSATDCSISQGWDSEDDHVHFHREVFVESIGKQ
jgi:hypothetical protein